MSLFIVIIASLVLIIMVRILWCFIEVIDALEDFQKYLDERKGLENNILKNKADLK